MFNLFAWLPFIGRAKNQPVKETIHSSLPPKVEQKFQEIIKQKPVGKITSTGSMDNYSVRRGRLDLPDGEKEKVWEKRGQHRTLWPEDGN